MNNTEVPKFLLPYGKTKINSQIWNALFSTGVFSLGEVFTKGAFFKEGYFTGRIFPSGYLSRVISGGYFLRGYFPEGGHFHRGYFQGEGVSQSLGGG